METQNCQLCKRPKGSYICSLCQLDICKKCLVKLPLNSFSFLQEIPKELCHQIYCGPCYDEKVGPELATYERTMEFAKQVNVFVRGQGEETRLISRKEKPLRVFGCEDKSETLLRLAFMASKANFNTLVDVEITPQKVKNKGYQTTSWSGIGIPTFFKEKTPSKNTITKHK